MHSLPIFVRLGGRPVILIGDGAAAAAKRRLLERTGATIVGEDDAAGLAIVACEDGVEAVADRLRARGVLVNVVDRPDLCDFTLPAIVDRDPVIVAIGTGGASAGLAKALRQRLEALLPARLGALADGLGGARAAIRAHWPDSAERRRAIDAALDPGGPLDPLGGRGDVETWLANAKAGEGGGAGDVVRMALASPDPDDLTLRQARLLGSADRLYHRPGVPAAILDRARADAARIACLSAPADPGAGLSLDISMEAAP